MNGHDLLLGGGDAVNIEDGRHGYGAGDQREGDRPLVRVAGRGGDDTDLTPTHLDRRAGRGQVAARAVQLQVGEAARGPAQVQDAGDGFLPAVAALRRVDGAAQPVHLGRDRARVGFAAQARLPRSDTHGLPRQVPGSTSRSCLRASGQPRGLELVRSLA